MTALARRFPSDLWGAHARELARYQAGKRASLDALTTRVDKPRGYLERKLAGLCTACGKREPTATSFTCEQCRRRANETARRHRAK